MIFVPFNKKAGRAYTVFMKKILFTGGGSAGHVVPNLALMHELRFSHEVSYMGTGGIEKGLVEGAGYPFYRVDCPKLVRSLCLENFKIPFALHRAKREALEIVTKLQPDLVFSKGGFASYPAVWAAHRLNIPVLTHESDLSAGLCTRLIARKCRYVLTSFPETALKFKNGKYVGSPVRREVLAGERGRSLKKYGLDGKTPVLLIFGGGSGSRAINEAVFSALPTLLDTFSILHLTGSGQAHIPEIKNKRGQYVPRAFENDMGSAYAAADLVLSRAGSNTVFELLALKKPAVLVPLQKSSRGDQLENARYFERQGLVKVLPEGELPHLSEKISDAYGDAAFRERVNSCKIESGTEAILNVISETLQTQAGGARV